MSPQHQVDPRPYSIGHGSFRESAARHMGRLLSRSLTLKGADRTCAGTDALLIVAQNAFKDYIGMLVLHKSTVSGMYLRDDPTILGWELANSPVCPGDDSGDAVQVPALIPDQQQRQTPPPCLKSSNLHECMLAGTCQFVHRRMVTLLR